MVWGLAPGVILLRTRKIKLRNHSGSRENQNNSGYVVQHKCNRARRLQQRGAQAEAPTRRTKHDAHHEPAFIMGCKSFHTSTHNAKTIPGGRSGLTTRGSLTMQPLPFQKRHTHARSNEVLVSAVTDMFGQLLEVRMLTRLLRGDASSRVVSQHVLQQL